MLSGDSSPAISCGAWGAMRTPHLLNNDSLEKEVGTVQRQQLLSLFTSKDAVWQAVILNVKSKPT